MLPYHYTCSFDEPYYHVYSVRSTNAARTVAVLHKRLTFFNTQLCQQRERQNFDCKKI